MKCSLVPQGGNRSVVVLVSDAVGEFADPFRREYDKDWFERVPPHISLLGPFVPEQSDEQLAYHLALAVESVEPFDVVLGAPNAFLVPELFLFLSIEDEPPLHLLHARALGALKSYRPEHSYHPHLTLGRFVSEANMSRVLSELKEGYARARAEGTMSFRVEEIHLFGEDPETGVYRSVAEMALRGEQD